MVNGDCTLSLSYPPLRGASSLVCAHGRQEEAAHPPHLFLHPANVTRFRKWRGPRPTRFFSFSQLADSRSLKRRLPGTDIDRPLFLFFPPRTSVQRGMEKGGGSFGYFAPVFPPLFFFFLFFSCRWTECFRIWLRCEKPSPGAPPLLSPSSPPHLDQRPGRGER